MMRLCAAVIITLLMPRLACANAPECSEAALDRTPDLPLTLATVAPGQKRVHFVEDGRVQPGCPSTAAECQDKAFLVPDDRILTGVMQEGFVCADYPNAKGLEKVGWLPAAMVKPVPPQPVGLADWTGIWNRVEADINIKPAKDGELLVSGEATWGADDPERVASGGVHDGDIEATARPENDRMDFDMVDGQTTLPVTSGGEDDCKVWMRRAGPWLVVRDNRKCGGTNVSFTGIYRRKGSGE